MSDLFSDSGTPQNMIRDILGIISKGLYEKEHIIALGLLCAFSGESFFLLGLPGTAKSEVSRRLKLVFREAKSFEYLMSRFSTPDEIFGPVSIKKLKEEDIYERQIEGYLPDADVVFLDEIWKAGPSIQNSLLTVLNEKIYRNGRSTIKLPMKLLIAASNEIPEKGSGLEALWDRFIMRVVSEGVRDEKNFFALIRSNGSGITGIPTAYQITPEVYAEWQTKILQVEIPDEILGYLSQLRKILAKKDEDGNSIYVSDRRWVKISRLLRTSAFLNSRNKVDWSDLLLLRHCLWGQVNEIPLVTKAIIDALIYQGYSELEAIEDQIAMISKQRVWFLPYNNTRKRDPSSLQTEALIPKVEKELDETAKQIISNGKLLKQSDNIFISSFDWELVGQHFRSVLNRVEEAKKKLKNERDRYNQGS